MEDKILKTIKKYELIESGDKVLIAVSGGPDSMCLLDILNKLKAKLGIEIAVAHVNHGISEEAKEETGIKKVVPISKDIYSLELINVNGHEKREK